MFVLHLIIAVCTNFFRFRFLLTWNVGTFHFYYLLFVYQYSSVHLPRRIRCALWFVLCVCLDPFYLFIHGMIKVWMNCVGPLSTVLEFIFIFQSNSVVRSPLWGFRVPEDFPTFRNRLAQRGHLLLTESIRRCVHFRYEINKSYATVERTSKQRLQTNTKNDGSRAPVALSDRQWNPVSSLGDYHFLFSNNVSSSTKFQSYQVCFLCV